MTVFSICNKNIVLDHRTDLEAQYLNHKQCFPAQIEKNSCYCINTRKKMFLFICLDLFSPTDYKVKVGNDTSSTIVSSKPIPSVTKFGSSSTKFSSDEKPKTTMVYSSHRIVPSKSSSSSVIHSTGSANSTTISTIVPSASITPKPMTSSPAASSSLQPTPTSHTS